MNRSLGSFALAASLLAATPLAAQVNLTYLHHFGPTPSDGRWLNPLIAGRDGALYGSTERGGPADQGTIYRLDTNSGARTVLFSFPASLANGVQPGGSLLYGSDGRLYGWMRSGGSSNKGTIFRLDRNGANYTGLRHLPHPPPAAAGLRVSLGHDSALIEGSDGRRLAFAPGHLDCALFELLSGGVWREIPGETGSGSRVAWLRVVAAGRWIATVDTREARLWAATVGRPAAAVSLDGGDSGAGTFLTSNGREWLFGSRAAGFARCRLTTNDTAAAKIPGPGAIESLDGPRKVFLLLV